MISCYLEAIKHILNIIETPHNCIALYCVYRASMEGDILMLCWAGCIFRNSNLDWKNPLPCRDLNPQPPWYLSNALPTELSWLDCIYCMFLTQQRRNLNHQLFLFWFGTKNLHQNVCAFTILMDNKLGHLRSIGIIAGNGRIPTTYISFHNNN